MNGGKAKGRTNGRLGGSTFMIWHRNCFASLLLVAAVRTAMAIELRFEYPAMERMLSQQLFTEDGRRYVQGSGKAKCTFAYLEKPKIGAWNGRLVIQARFVGKAALDVFGKCLGTGDAFDLTLVGTPVYQSGVIALKDVQASSNGKSLYQRRVMKGLEKALTKDIGYPVLHDAKTILEQQRQGQPFKQELSNFEILAVRPTDNALVLVLDFVLTVK